MTTRTRTVTQRPWFLPLALLALLPAATARGQDARLQIKNLEKLADKAAEVVDVTLDKPMLELASKFLKNEDDDAEARELIKDMKGIYVKSFEFDKEGEYSDADIEPILAQLKGPGWSKLVDVRSKRDRETDAVYIMELDGKIMGLAVIAAEPKELTIVNIVGPIDLDKLSKLEGHLGVPHLDLDRKLPKEGSHEHEE
ncbi:MAG: DUF4252 domain-containing protein [Terriglobia bacterium]